MGAIISENLIFINFDPLVSGTKNGRHLFHLFTKRE